jgi:hypothetical protein
MKKYYMEKAFAAELALKMDHNKYNENGIQIDLNLN